MSRTERKFWDIQENVCVRKSRGDTCCNLAWSVRSLALELSLKKLKDKIGVETFREIMQIELGMIVLGLGGHVYVG